MSRSSYFWLPVMVFFPLAAAGCSVGGTAHTEQVTSTRSSSGASVSLHRDPAEAALERGRQAVMESRFKDAEEAFRGVYETSGDKPEARAQALYELGELSLNLLNPARDRDRALGYFRTLVQKFPESSKREDAEAQIKALEAVGSD